MKIDSLKWKKILKRNLLYKMMMNKKRNLLKISKEKKWKILLEKILLKKNLKKIKVFRKKN